VAFRPDERRKESFVRLNRFVPAFLVLSGLLAPALRAQAPSKTKAAAAAAPASASTVPKVTFESYTLANGLQVILHVDRKLPIVHVNEWFHVGSKNERPGRTGFAHLFEHMMFQGSKNASNEYFSYAERAGANLGEGGVNGTTNNDRTNYFITVPSGSLEYVLWLESDRLATLADALTKEKLDNQRDVVKNERRQGLENTPYGRWFKLAAENLYPAGHPYSWTVIGSHEDLTAASLEDVRDFFKTYYTPNNLSLVVAGDFDPAEAKTLVAKYFGPIPPGPALDRPKLWVPKLSAEKIVEASDRVPQERVYMIWPTPPVYSPGDAELDLTSLILTDGLASRLARTLVYDKQLCSDVNAFQASAEMSSSFVIIATARPGASLAEVERVVTAEVARLAHEGPTPEELSRAKTKQEYAFVTGLERIGGFGGKADRLNSYATFLGDPNKFEFDQARYRNASAADIQKTVAQYLATPGRLLVRFHPEKSGRPTEAALDRAAMPALGADRPFHAPQVESAKLANGLDVFVVSRPELPKVAVNLVTRAGSIADPPGKAGTAFLTAAVLPLGTATRGALQIESAMGDLGTALASDAARESTQVSFEVLKRNLDPALAIFSDAVRNPAFPEAELAREKKRHLDALAQQANNGTALNGRLRAILLYGREHPYGRPVGGVPSSVEGITRQDLAAFHAARFKPGGSALVFVGDVTLAEAKAAAEKAFGSWSGGAPADVPIPPPAPAAAGKVYLVDRQDAAQTVVSVNLPGVTRDAPDYYAISVADGVWGGGASSRLDMNLRQDKGYAYGAFSFLTTYNRSGFWTGGAGVQTNKTKESIAEFEKELKDIAGGKPITEEEFSDTRNRMVRGYAQQFEALGRIDQQIADLWVAGLPMTDLQKDYDETGKVTRAAAQSAAETYAKPDKAFFVLIGDRAKIEPGLRELNVGEIVVMDPEGRPAGK
jgi:zinc protease